MTLEFLELSCRNNIKRNQEELGIFLPKTPTLYQWKTFISEKQKAEGKIIDPTTIIKLYTTLLLEIRKYLGNGNTNLKEKDMINHMIKDIDKLNF